MNNLKVLVVGSVNGQFDQFIQRMVTLSTKLSPLEAILCVGDFFSPIPSTNRDWQDVLANRLKQNYLNIYILGPTCAEQLQFYRKWTGTEHVEPSAEDFNSGFDLLEGLTFLGKKGVLNCASGLRIAYLSGQEGRNETHFTYTQKDPEYLVQLIKDTQVDILLTSQFPRQMHVNVSPDPPDYIRRLGERGSASVAQLALLSRPRYHFTSGVNAFYARTPYRNHRVLQETVKPVTRFVAMASIGNPQNEKWVYAFNIKSVANSTREELLEQPAIVTENPYLDVELGNGRSDQSFFYDMSGARKGIRKPKPVKAVGSTFTQEQLDTVKAMQGEKRSTQGEEETEQEQKAPKRLRSDDCWFCLANPQVEKNLIISIGNSIYMALAKGGLVAEHFLLLPITHHRTLLEIEDEKERVEAFEELKKFKDALKQHFKKTDRVPVFFERNFKGMHAQIQVVPIPEENVIITAEIFQRLCLQRNLQVYPLEEDQEIYDLDLKGPYFLFELDDQNRFYIKLKSSMNFSLQFGREILAHPEVLNVMESIDWRKCVLNDEKAKEVVEQFRESFKPLDFTL